MEGSGLIFAPRGTCSVKSRATFILLSVAVLLAPVGVGAKLCGDNVGGQDVPCACGDTVVSSLSLGDDPVLDGVCPADGLIVRVPSGSPGVTVDLQGKTLQGSGNGAGVWVITGGVGGARVVSTGGPATIEGFRDGILGHGADAVRLIDGIVVLQSTRDGMRVGWTFGGDQAIDNDGNGILVGGHDVVDAGGNSGSGNRGLRQQRPAVQCEIDGQPCRP